MNSLILVRGAPGSGKSTFAKSRIEKERQVHLEADMYHMTNGKYEWKRENVKAAHEWCQRTTRILLENGYDVIVSNTFTEAWEIEPYFQMATLGGHDLVAYRMMNEFDNIHNVSKEQVERMRNRMVDWPGEIKVKDYVVMV